MAGVTIISEMLRAHVCNQLTPYGRHFEKVAVVDRECRDKGFLWQEGGM